MSEVTQALYVIPPDERHTPRPHHTPVTHPYPIATKTNHATPSPPCEQTIKGTLLPFLDARWRHPINAPTVSNAPPLPSPTISVNRHLSPYGSTAPQLPPSPPLSIGHTPTSPHHPCESLSFALWVHRPPAINTPPTHHRPHAHFPHRHGESLSFALWVHRPPATTPPPTQHRPHAHFPHRHGESSSIALWVHRPHHPAPRSASATHPLPPSPTRQSNHRLNETPHHLPNPFWMI